jgi:hypothetical protein
LSKTTTTTSKEKVEIFSAHFTRFSSVKLFFQSGKNQTSYQGLIIFIYII